MRSSKPVFSIFSMGKRRAQVCVSTAEEPCISVITTPNTGSSIAHVMRGVNPHYGGFLGDNFTPKTPIRVVIEEGLKFSAEKYCLYKEFNSST